MARRGPPINPADYRPTRKGEPGYGARRYVRRDDPAQSISVRQFQQARSGKTLEQAARERFHTPESAAKREHKRAALQKTLEAKKKYPGETRSDIERYQDLKQRKIAGERLNQRDFDWMMKFANRHPETERDFLNMDFINSPPRKRRGIRSFRQVRIASTRKAIRKKFGVAPRTERGH